MTRLAILASAATALTLTLVTACDKASDEQQQANRAQGEADKKANAAQAEADRKINEANKEATTKTTSAQMEADKKIATAEVDFANRREDYRHTMQTDLIALDKKIDLFESKVNAATGKAKTDLDARVAPVRARRAAFGKSLDAIQTTAAVRWDDTKTRLDKDWSELKSVVDKLD